MGLSVIIITKNEAQDLPRALDSVSFADEVIVLDSGSTDGTQKIAKEWGAKLFQTDDWPGFGPQKNRALERASQEWVLSLDADEWLECGLACEIKEITAERLNQTPKAGSVEAFRIRRRSIFIDRMIRFGDWSGDRVVRLFRRHSARFSDDLVHERLIVNGCTRDLSGFIGHLSVRSIEESRSKMWHYNRAAALRLAGERRGGVIKGLYKAIFSLFRGLILRLGFLDGVRGLQLAWFNAFGTYLRYSLAKGLERSQAGQLKSKSQTKRVRDVLELMLVDHGFLRSIYANLFSLPGGLYRANQPSPRRLRLYKEKYRIKTVINLRGKNEQLGWYRLEEEACKELGLNLVNIQVFSRGLVSSNRLVELKKLIENLELPAVVHCKSGADRAGFFSVLYRHYRLGEPIEMALQELGIRYGHIASAKTGILDYFFKRYISDRLRQQGFDSWCSGKYSPKKIEDEFKSSVGWDLIVSKILRRE